MIDASLCVLNFYLTYIVFLGDYEILTGTGQDAIPVKSYLVSGVSGAKSQL